MNKFTNTIFIPNAPPVENFGDVAMLESLLSLLSPYKKEYAVTLASRLKDQRLKTDNTCVESIYEWVYWGNTNAFVRAFRYLSIILYLLICALGFRTFIFDKKLQKIIEPFFTSKIIVFVGCGYLRSKHGFKQIINWTLVLIPYLFAKVSKKTVILCPFGFGPFAYSWQEQITAKVLDGFAVIAVRDQISYGILKKYAVHNLHVLHDHAMLLKKTFHNMQIKPVIGINLRPWFEPTKQLMFEAEFVDAVSRFSKQNKVLIKPIVQVHSKNARDEDDYRVMVRLEKKFKKRGIKILSMNTNKTVASLKQEYSQVMVLVAMRMHANILAATEHTPFLAVEYEHKTRGIALSLGCKNNVIPAKDLSAADLYTLLSRVYRNSHKERIRLKEKISKIQLAEYSLWDKIFRRYLYPKAGY